MGEGGYINIVNGSPYQWRNTYTSSYQMTKWSFPATIDAGKAATVYVEWDTAHNRNDDGGEVTYEISNPDRNSFQLQARGKGGFKLQNLFNFALQNNAAGSTIPLGWKHDGHVNFVLSGSQGSFTGSNPPTAWMQANIQSLGPRTLRQIVMPGSHDAGMSVRTGGTAGSFPCNTLTQTKSVAEQLKSGARYFDIRPVISGGAFFTGHYSKIGESWQGGNGQKISEIIDQINAFTANNQELIVINLSHDLNTDLGNEKYTGLTQAEWDRLFNELTRTNNRFVAPGDPTTVDLTKLTLNQFIKDRAAVVFIVEPGAAQLGGYATSGFYRYSQFDAYNNFASSNNLDNMINDQLSKMKTVRTSPDSQFFLLSWTLTQDAGQVIGCVFEVVDSIIDLGFKANPQLFARLLNSITKTSYPNVLYVDSLEGTDLAALAMAINNYVHS